jgi:hypothetical protein
VDAGMVLALVGLVAGTKLVYHLLLKRNQLQLRKKMYERMLLERLRKNLGGSRQD